jgi:hypothetical protein
MNRQKFLRLSWFALMALKVLKALIKIAMRFSA